MQIPRNSENQSQLYDLVVALEGHAVQLRTLGTAGQLTKLDTDVAPILEDLLRSPPDAPSQELANVLIQIAPIAQAVCWRRAYLVSQALLPLARKALAISSAPPEAAIEAVELAWHLIWQSSESLSRLLLLDPFVDLLAEFPWTRGAGARQEFRRATGFQ